MEAAIQESIDNILYQVKSAKSKGKKSIKVKVYQANAEMGVMYCLCGMRDAEDKGVQYLKENGYIVNFETNNKQISMIYNMKGELASSSSKDLRTTSMIVSW